MTADGDWVVDYLNGLSLVGILVTIVGSLLVIPALVLIHELGHALTAAALGHRVRELRVGDDAAVLTVRSCAFLVRLGPFTGESDTLGYVVFDGSRVSARHLLLIALAGPVASLGAAFAAAWGLFALDSHPFVLMLALVGALDGFGNLSSRRSDGRQVRAAWRALRSPAPPPRPRPVEPHTDTSVAPPGY